MQCKYCQAEVTWIRTHPGNKPMICEATAIQRDGSDPPKPGRYIDHSGNLYLADEVPCKLPVYRVHWGDCLGAKQTHRDR